MGVRMRYEADHERIAARAFNWRLSRGIDIGHDHNVRLVKRASKTIKQRMEPRVTVGLNNGDDPALRRGTGGAQDSRDFDRMVTIIIENESPIPLADAGEAAL